MESDQPVYHFKLSLMPTTTLPTPGNKKMSRAQLLSMISTMSTRPLPVVCLGQEDRLSFHTLDLDKKDIKSLIPVPEYVDTIHASVAPLIVHQASLEKMLVGAMAS